MQPSQDTPHIKPLYNGCKILLVLHPIHERALLPEMEGGGQDGRVIPA